MFENMHKKTISNRRRERGFTLIEVMVATALIGIGVLTVTLALMQSIRSNQISKDMTSMVNMIEDWTERLQGIPRAQATVLFGPWGNTCENETQNFRNLINVDESQPGSGALGYQTLLAPKLGPGVLNPVNGGPGVIVAYDLDAYCPPSRREGATSATTPNTYRLTGRAFLVKNVAAGSGNYEIITSQFLRFVFTDRPPSI